MSQAKKQSTSELIASLSSGVQPSEGGSSSTDIVSSILIRDDGQLVFRQVLPPYHCKRTGVEKLERTYDYTWGIELSEADGDWYTQALMPTSDYDPILGEQVFVDGDHCMVTYADNGMFIPVLAGYVRDRLVIPEGMTNEKYKEVYEYWVAQAGAQVHHVMGNRTPKGGPMVIQQRSFSINAIEKKESWCVRLQTRRMMGFSYWLNTDPKQPRAAGVSGRSGNPFERQASRYASNRFVNGR